MPISAIMADRAAASISAETCALLRYINKQTTRLHGNVPMSKPIRKAIFPVAGLGTRFLPATKAMPKEMLTVVDRPIIQHVVDEARTGGIEHFIFVTGRNKGVIEDHFDRQFELEEVLKRRNKQEELQNLEHLLPGPGATSLPVSKSR